jgi:ATP-dependent DNA helicase RecG
MLQGLSNRGFLVQKGKKRGTFYVLPEKPDLGVSMDSQLYLEDSQHFQGYSQHLAGDSQHFPEEPGQTAQLDNDWEELERIAQPVAGKRRVEKAFVRRVIVQLCRDRYLSASDLARLLHRHKVAIHQRYLRPMVEEGILEMKFPNRPNNPDQAYMARERKLEL